MMCTRQYDGRDVKNWSGLLGERCLSDVHRGLRHDYAEYKGKQGDHRPLEGAWTLINDVSDYQWSVRLSTEKKLHRLIVLHLRFGLMINTLAENLHTFSWFPDREKYFRHMQQVT